MKKGFFLVFVLVFCVTATYPSGRLLTNHFIIGSAFGDRIWVMDWEIPPNVGGDLRMLRSTVITAPGSVGWVGTSTVNAQGNFSVDFYYQDGPDDIDGRSIQFEFDTFRKLREFSIQAEYGGYSGGTFRARTGAVRGRVGLVQPDFDVAFQKYRDATGRPAGPQTQIFDNDSDFFPVATGYEWDAFYAAQVVFQRSTGDFFGDFVSLKPNGKPNDDLKRYRFQNDVVNVALGDRFQARVGFTYTVATRDVKVEGTTYKTAVALNQFNSDNTPIDSRIIYNFKPIPERILNAAVFNSVYIASYDDRRWLMAGVPAGGKFITVAWEFDAETLQTLNKQTIISKADLNRWNTDSTYALYGTHTRYYDDDDW